MATRIAFNINVAHTDVTNSDEVLDFIEAQSNEVTTYRHRPLGGITNNVDGYLLVFNTVASFASIASFFWLVYDKFIGDKKDPDSNAGIILRVAPAQRDVHINFWLGGQQKTEEEFVNEFVSQLERVPTHADSEYQQAVDRIMADSSPWVRRSDFNPMDIIGGRIDQAEMEELSRQLDKMKDLHHNNDGK
ncbi:MAG: hypothetical protein H6822_27365 [Planctomycetaceae bacterium]|nr:hypothetical protein [Planctomycetales bacterium]MCB9925899.1 hypothetical protein [Planctomycetaceae bacterium]